MTATTPSGCYRFAHFELQPDERRLLADGNAVRIGAHAFDLLLVLVERSGRLVTKDELLERVWSRLVVEENTLQVHVSALRKILGAEAIATISGRGYRFALDVTHIGPPASAATATPRHNLPQHSTSFVGREKQVAELTHLLRMTRLLTLTGAGGCGKTRLATQVAAELVQKYPDGVWLVELAPLANQGLVPQLVATVLGTKEQPNRRLTQTLVEHVGSKRLLLFLDNAEHVLGACAQLADTMLRSCEHLAVLVTSRERMGIAGENTYRVPSLSIPEATERVDLPRIAECESVRLFLDRARLQRPHFAVTPDNVSAVVAICRRLDGIPLAIELAAARVRSMAVEEVSRRLDQRFSLLTGGARTALPRQRTLRSLIDWSYDLLKDSEKTLLNRVSVFAGGCTLEAAEQVCAGNGVETRDVLDLLASLVDKSLLVADENDGATRYRLLETVRHYVHDQLRHSGEEAQLQAEHLRCFVALTKAFAADLTGRRDIRSWLERLEMEHDNLRAALAWSMSAGGDAASGLLLGGHLSWFWAVRGYLGEAREWLSALLALAPGEQDPVNRVRALVGAGVVASQQGDDSAAQALYEESLAICRRTGNRSGTAYALRSLGNVAVARGDFATARALKEESLALERELGNRFAVGELLGVLGEVAAEQGDYVAARSHLEECLAIYRESDERWTLAWTRGRLGRVTYAQGEYSLASEQFKQALALIRELGDQWGIASFLEGFAAVAVVVAGPARAASIWGGAERLREDVGTQLPASDRVRYERQVAAARAALGDDAAFDRAWQEGRAMTTAQTIDYALDTQVGAPRC